MEMTYVLLGMRNPAELDTELTRHKLALESEARRDREARRAARRVRTLEKYTPRPQPQI